MQQSLSTGEAQPAETAIVSNPSYDCPRFHARCFVPQPKVLSLRHMENAAIQTHGLTRRFGALTLSKMSR